MASPSLSWLKPAIRWMNRMSFPQKFALISSCFAIPLVLVLCFFNSSKLDDIDDASYEADGVDYLIPLNSLHNRLPETASLARAYLLKEGFAMEHYPMRQAEIDSLMNALAEVDARLGAKLKTTDKFRIIRAQWEDFKGQLPKLTPAISDDQFQKIMSDVEEFMAYVGDQSRLILDPDLDSYYLMSTILLHLPESDSIVSRTRRFVGARPQDADLTDPDYDELRTQASLLRNNLKKLQRSLGVAFLSNNSRTVQAAVDQPLSQYSSATESLLRLVEETATQGGKRHFTIELYQNTAAIVLSSNVRLWERSAQQMKVVLAFRKDALWRSLLITNAVAFAAVMAAIYLWLAFYRSVMGTVNALQNATERMKSGQENILVDLDAKDELGKVGHAFNEVALELLTAGRNYRSIFEGSVDGIFRTDPEGRYLEANSALARIYKYKSIEDFLSRHLTPNEIYVDPLRRHQFREAIARDDVLRDFESEVHCGDGSTTWITETARATRDDKGQVMYYEGLVRDITDQKLAETALTKAMEEAQTANRAKTEFLANMSHEIRTPMNAVLGFSELLKGLVHEPRQRSYLQAITSSGQTLLALINDILDLSKIDAGKLTLDYDAINIGVVLRDIRHIFSQKAEQKGIEMLLEIAPNVPTALLLDEVRMRQILFNVVGNAIKFTETGHVKIRASVGKENTAVDAIELVIEVEDTGIGIAEDEQQRIFEAFSQQEGQNVKKFGGTGLGLTITERLVKMMHGQISIKSQVGLGSTFRFVFPEVKRTSATKDLSSASNEQAYNLADLEPSVVLVADDIIMNRDLIRAFFFGTAHTLLEASNGREALEIARREHPDIILMDVRMPVMDGVQATRALKSDETLKSIPVIIVTASAMQSEEAELRPICDGYLRKPVSQADLAAQIRKFRNRRIPAPERPALMNGSAGEKPELPLSSSQLEALKERLLELEPAWKKLLDAAPISEVDAFAKSLLELANEFDHKPLRTYATKLQDQVKSFNVSGMETTLRDFNSLPGCFDRVEVVRP